MGPAAPLASFEARLPPELESVGAARRLVDEAATTWGVERDVWGDAALAISELVTNSVLHAKSEVGVVIRRLGQGMRLEISDGSARMPVVGVDRPQDLLETRSMTGRGLRLVAATADRWGSDPIAGEGKCTWAEVGTGRRHLVAMATPRYPHEAAIDVTLSRGTVVGVVGGVTAVTAVARQGRKVHLVGVPVQLLVESVRQLADLQRELELIGLDHDTSNELVELADSGRELDPWVTTLREEGLEPAQSAISRGDEVVDFDVELPDNAVYMLDRLTALVRRAATPAARSRLLTEPASPQVNAYRAWYRDEVMSQIAGRDPRPCPLATSSTAGGS